MPAGLDTVAMQEDCREQAGAVAIPRGLKPGANRRRAGEDVKQGATLLAAGHRLRPQDVGLVASIGRRAAVVFRPLRAAVFSTGDEVYEPGTPAGPGGIYDANRFVAIALLEGLGCAVTDLGILKDDRRAIQARLAEAAHAHDLLLTSGGVSVGEEDHVKAAVEALGSLHLWRLAIKPGRPIALGQIGRVPFVGLPGNPVAAMVTFLRFARPLILRLAGATDVAPNFFRVRADFAHKKKKNRREFLRARLRTGGDGSPIATKFERQGAGILSSLVASDGLVELPEELTDLAVGDMVDFLPFAEVAA
jgi:molybdopterin molybdotransferase